MRAVPGSGVVLAATLAALALGGAACGGDDSASASSGALTVSAAASLADAFPAYGETLPGEERFSFAGSDELAAQIRQGAKPDVFASANTTYPDELHEEGLVRKPVVFTHNQLVIAVPAEGSRVDSIGDLSEPGLDLVIGAEGVPVGDYTRDVIARLPALQADASLANVRSEESDVKGIVGKIAQGAADAGFVYASDVAAAADELDEVTLPGWLEPQVSYAIAVVAGAEEPERAREFVHGLLEPEGQRILRDAGFLPLS